MQIDPGNKKAYGIAQKVISEVEKEKSRVARMQGSDHDKAKSSDAVVLNDVARNPIVRALGDFGPDTTNRWTAQATLKAPHDPEVTTMQSKAGSGSTNEVYGFRETEDKKVYGRTSEETTFFAETPSVKKYSKLSVTITVDKKTGALFMEDEREVR